MGKLSIFLQKLQISGYLVILGIKIHDTQVFKKPGIWKTLHITITQTCVKS